MLLQAVPITLSVRQFDLLDRERNRHKVSVQYRFRIDVILYAHQGKSSNEIVRILDTYYHKVQRWRDRWAKSYGDLCAYEKGINNEGISDGLLLAKMLAILSDEDRSGRPPMLSLSQKEQIVALACKKPTDFGLPFEEWSGDLLATLACQLGIVPSISGRWVNAILKKEKSTPISATIG